MNGIPRDTNPFHLLCLPVCLPVSSDGLPSTNLKSPHHFRSCFTIWYSTPSPFPSPFPRPSHMLLITVQCKAMQCKAMQCNARQCNASASSSSLVRKSVVCCASCDGTGPHRAATPSRLRLHLSLFVLLCVFVCVCFVLIGIVPNQIVPCNSLPRG